MKYIIDIDEKPFVQKSALHGEKAVYKAKAFNTLVFDEEGLSRLTPYNEQAELKAGDVVISKQDSITAIVLDADSDNAVWLFDENGCCYMVEPEECDDLEKVTHTEITDNLLRAVRGWSK